MKELFERHACKHGINVLVILGIVLFVIGLVVGNVGVWIVGVVLFVVGLGTRCKRSVKIEVGGKKKLGKKKRK